MSLLRRHYGPVPTEQIPLPILSEDSRSIPAPEEILDRLVVQRDHYQPRTELLVKWCGASREDATWENARRFSESYPEFFLEDKEF